MGKKILGYWNKINLLKKAILSLLFFGLVAGGVGYFAFVARSDAAPTRVIELISFNDSGAAQQGTALNIAWQMMGGTATDTVSIYYSTDFAVSSTTVSSSVASISSSTAFNSYSCRRI